MNDLCADIGYYALNHAGEQLCGDHIELQHQGENSTIIVLADGQVKQDGKREQILPELLAAPTVCSALADKIQ